VPPRLERPGQIAHVLVDGTRLSPGERGDQRYVQTFTHARLLLNSLSSRMTMAQRYEGPGGRFTPSPRAPLQCYRLSCLTLPQSRR
jgi:hypothetical protein